MSGIYCAFCYFELEGKRFTTQEILTTDRVDKTFVVGLNIAARAAAYELAVKHISNATKRMTSDITYRYGYFSVEPGDVRQEGATLTKELERGDAML